MRSILLRVFGGITAVAAITALALVPAADLFSPDAPSSFTETVPPAPLLLVCPGAAIELGGEDGTDVESLERLGTADLALHSGDPDFKPTFSPDASLAESLRLQSWAAIELRDSPREQGTDLLSAAQYQVVSNARNRGLLATGCLQPMLQQTFVGGSLADGHETLLILVNPGANESGVTVRLTTDTGSTEESYSVTAASERIVPLGALGEGESSIAVAVSSTQPVGAWLQHRASAGLEPLGISWVTRQPEPSQLLNIFGLVVRGTADAPTAELVTPSVRVFNPGSADTEALVEVTGVESFGTVVRLNVPAGRVREVPIEGLSDGEYSVRISSESAVFASIKSPVVVTSGATDYAWLAGSEAISQTLRFPAQPVKGSLILFNPGSSELSLTVDATLAGGATVTRAVTLAPLQQQIVEIEAGRSVLVSGPQGIEIVASLRFLNGNGIEYWQPSPNRNPGSEISVSVR